MFIYVIISLFICAPEYWIRSVYSTISVIDKGILPLTNNSIAIQFYIDIENKDPKNICKFASWPQQCCLNNPAENDCDVMHAYGSHLDFVEPKNRKTLTFIYPSIHQHDQVGSCQFILNHKCRKSKEAKKQKVDIHFDTRITKDKEKELLANYVADQKIFSCDSLDQDSLGHCQPVDCNLKYLDARTFYDHNLHKCLEAPICDSDVNKELPDQVYVPIMNTCRDLEHPLTVADIYAISSRLGVVTNSPVTTEYDDKVELKPNCSTISQNLYLLKDMLYGKLCAVTNGADYKNPCIAALLAITSTIVSACGLLIGIVCCLNILLWLHKKWADDQCGKLWKDCKRKLKLTKTSVYHPKDNVVNSNIKNALLRDVIIKNIPIELRDSVVNICERMGNEVKHKKRYRRSDIGSQLSLNKAENCSLSSDTTSTTSSFEDDDEKEKLLK